MAHDLTSTSLHVGVFKLENGWTDSYERLHEQCVHVQSYST